jgi:hypothetical protein
MRHVMLTSVCFRRLLRLTVLLCAITSLHVSATTMESLSVEQLTVSSESVVRGKVVRIVPRWTSDKKRIVTDTEIQVTEVLKPHVAVKSTLVAMQPGGELGDVGQVVSGVASFGVGEEVIVFLEVRGDRFVIAGMAQGKYSIDPVTQMAIPQLEGLELLDPKGQRVVGQVSAIPVSELRRRVLAAIPRVTPDNATAVPTPRAGMRRK